MKHRRPTLQPLLRRWQRKLHLLDWDITAEYITKRDKPDATYVGQCRCNPDRSRATIVIMDPRVDPHCVEETLKHELLHVALWCFVEDSPAALTLEERFIERMVPLLR